MAALFLLFRKIYKAYYERKIVGSVVEQHNYREGRRSESYTVFSFIFFLERRSSYVY